jgi:MFS family permease
MTDFQRIVAMNTLAGVGMGLVGIFIPIYLLELNYSFFTVISWLLVHHLSLLFGAFLVVYVSNTIGLVRCWYVRTILVTLFFGGLLLLPSYPILLFAIALVSGMESAFFWIPYNILTVRKTEDTTIGSSLAFMSNVGSAVGIAVPGLAALLIISYGYGILFAVALVFILVSIVPVLSLRHEKTDFQFNMPAIKKIVSENKSFILPEILDNLGQDAQIIWTLFIFITALTVLDIGVLGVLVGLIGMGVTYATGKLIDRWDKKTIVRIGAVATTFMWVVSYLVAIYSPTQVMLYVVTALRGLALGVFVAAYGAIMFNRARSADAQFLVLREVPTIFGRMLLFVITLALLSIGQFELIFIVVAIFSLYFWFNNLDSLIKRPQVRNSDI